MPYTPDDIAVSQILGKIDTILANLLNTSACQDRLEPLKTTLAELKKGQPGSLSADLPMKGNSVDTSTWGAKSEADRQKTWNTLSAIHRELRDLNADSLASGKRYFKIFSFMLLVVTASYLCTHQSEVRQQIHPSPSAKDRVEIIQRARTIEITLSSLKEKQNNLRMLGPDFTVKPASAPKPGEKPAPPSTAGSPSPTQQDLEAGNKVIADEVDALKTQLALLPLGYETLRLLGTFIAEFETHNSIAFNATYPVFLKNLQAELESLSTPYFWTIQPWRWVEISLWAEIGCLVGLLFYIAGLLAQGVFKPEEGFMFWAELLIAPIAVPVVFFLFSMTGMTEFAPNQTSITMNIGVAFIFGFAIRRTIGLLDIIKKRFFPDPSPGSATPGN